MEWRNLVAMPAKFDRGFASAKFPGHFGIGHRSQQTIISLRPRWRLRGEGRDAEGPPAIPHRCQRPSQAASEFDVGTFPKQRIFSRGEAGMGGQRRAGVAAVVAEQQLEDVAVEDQYAGPGPPFQLSRVAVSLTRSSAS